MSNEKPVRKPFHEAFAEKIIQHLEAGTAPWQKPWHPGKDLSVPNNPQTGTIYKGMNRLNLALTQMTAGYSDPRWLTLKQANDMGLRIKKGSKSEVVMYYQFTKEQDRLDENGKAVLGADGKPERETVHLDRPIMRGAHVFNAEQIEGMPPLELTDKAYDWNPEEKAETILSASGAAINHDQGDRAFYRSRTDSIHLPPRENFEDPGKYYSTALHELGHWTRHSTRLNRESGPFGSEPYAREELRAEIASWMLGEDIGIPHDPGQHSSYVASWVESLKNDPYEIVRACRDAEHIKGYVMGLEQRKELTQDQASVAVEATQDRDMNVAAMGVPVEPNLATENTFLAVPYAERNQAKDAGARWDNGAKLWYAPEGADLAKLDKWLPEHAPAPTKTMNPQDEFAQALHAAGLDLKGRAPVMDGQIHRTPLLEGSGAPDGSYLAHADGVPNGWIRNFSTGEHSKWIATGHVLTPEQKQAMQAEHEQRRQEREATLAVQHEQVASFARSYYEERHPAPSDHAYLARKGIEPGSLRVTPTGAELIVPLINTSGEIRSLQYISGDGSKRFEPGGQKRGNFHLIGADINTDGKNLAQGEILLAEGYATGASLHTATGKPVAVAFDSGNLLSVAQNIREKFPNAAITICADNDHAHTHTRNGVTERYNVGVEKAREAAHAVGGKVVIPDFTDADKARGLTDFNDLHSSRDSIEVCRQISRQMEGREKLREHSAATEVAL